MRKIVCAYCDEFQEEVFRKLETCPKCSRDLLARIRHRKAMTMARPQGLMSHPVERDYSGTPVTYENEPLEHTPDELIRYVMGLAEAASKALGFIAQNPKASFLVGFQTGSDPLIFLLRRHAGERLEGRILQVRGQSHSAKGKDPKAELFCCLDEFGRKGLERLVVIDELVSGTQFRTAYLRIIEWYRIRKEKNPDSRPLVVHLIGLQGAEPPKGKKELATFEGDVFKKRPKTLPGGLTFESSTIRIPELLAKDGPGRFLKSTWLRRSDGEYITARRFPAYYDVRCRNELSAGGCVSLTIYGSSGSFDQSLGVVAYSILGLGYVDRKRWPESIRDRGCDECNALLAEARKVGDALECTFPSKEPVVGKVVGPRKAPGKRLITPEEA